MEIPAEHYEKLKHILPVQRGNVSVENVIFINAILYVCENGCKWRKLPKEYGYWHPIYKRFNRWVKAGIIDKLGRVPTTITRLIISISKTVVKLKGEFDEYNTRQFNHTKCDTIRCRTALHLVE